MNHKRTGESIMIGASLLAAGILAAYAYVYRNAPLPGNGNDLVTSGLTIFAAVFAAINATLVYRSYRSEDVPRIIWQNFALGIWMWAIGEAIWYFYYLTAGDVPSPSLSDLAWNAGYVFLTIAFYKQYRLFFRTPSRQARTVALGAWASALAVAFLLHSIFGRPAGAAFFDYFYPVADLTCGVIALHMLWVFHGGAMVRPWIGIFAFTLSDAAYAWLEQSGLYASASSSLALAVDLVYIAAYLILAIGFLGQYILVHYEAYSLSNSSDHPL